MRKRGKKSIRPNEQEFFDIYNDERYTVQQIADLYGVKKATIYNWASQFYKENSEKVSDKQIFHRLYYNIKKRKKA